jgi:phosphotriesterase-related protein
VHVQTVETVTGPHPLDELGAVLMHEHVIGYSDHMRQQWPHLHDYENAPISAAVEALSSAKARGIDTVVDCTTPNMGRHVAEMREVSQQSGVTIICCTGYHPVMGVDFYFEYASGVGITVDRLADMFERDIVVGAQGTDIKAGVIKVGTALERDPWQEIVLRAAARAHRRTGVPITTHSEPAIKDGLYQLDVFESEGVDLSRVIVGHSGDSKDYAYLQAMISRGCSLGMDRFGFLVETFRKTVPTDERIKILADMVALGASGNLVLSHDACVWCDYFPPEHVAEVNPEWNISYLTTVAVPLILAAGVSESNLDIMLRANPMRLLERCDPY